MSDKVKTNLYLDKVTPKRIEELSKATIRGKNDVVDWAVLVVWNQVFGPASVSVETVSPAAEEAVS